MVQRSAEDVIGTSFVSEFLGVSSKEAQETFARALGHDKLLEESGKKLVDVKIPLPKASDAEPDRVVDLLMSVNHMDNAVGEKVLMCVGQDVTEVRSFRALEEKKAQMLAVVSHELRSPLHGIIGITETAHKGATRSSQKRQLRLISDCAKRLVDFVSTMMDLTAMQKHTEFALNNDPVVLVKLLDDVALLLVSAHDKYGRAMVKKSVSLVCDYRAIRLPIMEADAYRLTQVFFNIIGNALKFTEKGSVHVMAQTEIFNNEQCVVVEVRDTGKGIAPAALSRIFEPFEQEDSSDIRQHAGLGLGLAISREIVRKHGGDIKVETEVGKGSSFFIYLPLRSNASTELETSGHNDSHSQSQSSQQEDSRITDDIPSSSLEDTSDNFSAKKCLTSARLSGSRLSSSPAAGRLQPATIMESPVPVGTALGSQQRYYVLSVDDEPVNQEVIRGMFGNASQYTVDYAMTGQEALEKLAAERYDIVLLDLMMPGMSGLEVLVKIRRTKNISHLPVIMVSAKNQSDVISDALWKGATDFLVKPLDCDTLIARIARNLEAPLKEHGTSSAKSSAKSKPREKTFPETRRSRSATCPARQGSGGNRSEGSPGTWSGTKDPVFAALAVAFTADSSAAVPMLETVFTFIERTVEMIAER